jgi:hypothetical protein
MAMTNEELNALLKATRDQKFRKRTQGQIEQAEHARGMAEHLKNDPAWQAKQAEGQRKRKAEGWQSKMLGNTNGRGNKGRKGKPHTEEHKQYMSQKMMGRKIPSITGVPKPKETCPHCGKIGGRPQMIQYHFDKCKFKKS